MIAWIPALLEALLNKVDPLNVALMVLLMRDEPRWEKAAKMVERAQFVKYASEGVSSEELEVYLNAMAHYSKKKRGFYFVRAAVDNYRQLLVNRAK
uniref:RxLR effector candidate protein n=1 Tax=Hyaloperonospora arabidopsidis (strain Emoy2) TaxID=559515 RepID=M4BZN2_HYAAE